MGKGVVNEPSRLMDMSMAAWPSIEPASPRCSACSRAASMSRAPTNNRSNTARTGSLLDRQRTRRCGCAHQQGQDDAQPTTRLVEPISNAIAAVKLAPLRNSDHFKATAAYEYDDGAAPRPVAITRVRGRRRRAA